MFSRFSRANCALALKVAEMGEPERRAQVFAEFDPVFFGDREEDFDDLGIELRAGAAPNLFASVRERQGFAIGAIADHGVKRVGDREDAGAERDLFAF